MKQMIGIFVVVVVIWLAWAPLRVFLFGGRLSYANTPQGDWVGEMQVNPGEFFAPPIPGLVVGKPRTAAVRFTLSVTDAFMDEYGGPGEMYIAGESHPRAIRIGAFRLHKTGAVHTAVITQNPLLFGGADGTFAGDIINLHDDSIDDLRFTASLHRGGQTEYDALVNKLQSSALHAAVAAPVGIRSRT